MKKQQENQNKQQSNQNSNSTSAFDVNSNSNKNQLQIEKEQLDYEQEQEDNLPEPTLQTTQSIQLETLQAYEQIDDEIRKTYILSRLRHPSEWDDCLSCFVCIQCGSSMRELRKAQIEREFDKRRDERRQKLIDNQGKRMIERGGMFGIKNKQKNKQDDKLNKEKDKDNKIDSDEKGNVWFKDEEESNKNEQQSNKKNKSQSNDDDDDDEEEFQDNDEDTDTIEEDTPLYRLLDHLEDISNIPIGKEEEEQEISQFEKQLEKEMQQLEKGFQAKKNKQKLKEEQNNEEEQQEESESESDKQSPFSQNWQDYNYCYVCRRHPSQHRIIAGFRAQNLIRRCGRAWATATDIEVDSEAFGGKIPPRFFIRGLLRLNELVHIFRHICHPFHEAIIQAMYATVSLLYHGMAASDCFRNILALSAPRVIAIQRRQQSVKEKEKEKMKEKLNKINNDEEQEIKMNMNDTDKLSISGLPSLKVISSIKDKPDQEALISTPLLSTNLIQSAVRYVSQYVQLIQPGYPRRALDLKMCGIVLILAAQDAPSFMKDESEDVVKKQEQNNLDIKLDGINLQKKQELLKNNENNNSEQISVFDEGMKLLQQALKEGVLCFGEGHCEMQEIKFWLNGGWKRLPCYERRQYAKDFFNQPAPKPEMDMGAK